MENPYSDLPHRVDPTRCLIDLERLDVYPAQVIPDEDVEICLKVLRSVRDWSLDADAFDADAAVVLSHAHACIVGKVKAIQDIELAEVHTV